jgi:uncharacterized phage infection (PIP) family protein YhgE
MIKKLNYKKLSVAIVIPIVLQVVMLFILIPPIKSLNSHVDDLTVAFVNDDTAMGSKIAHSLKKNLPFAIKTLSSKQKALKSMDDGTYQMVIDIPADFSSQIQKGSGTLSFYINQAVPPTVKSVMDQTAKQITASINENIYGIKKENLKKAVLASIQQRPAGSIPSAGQNKMAVVQEKKAAVFKEMISGIFDQLQIQTVKGSITQVHPAAFVQSILPMLSFLSSFAGAIVFTYLVFQELQQKDDGQSKWTRFLHHELIQLVASLVFPLAMWTTIQTFSIDLPKSTVLLWGFMSLAFFTFSQFALFFLYLFGPAGQAITGLLVLIQVISGGIILPAQMLPDLYREIGSILPGNFYGRGIYRLFIGGPSIHSPVLSLLTMSAVLIILTAATVLVKGKWFSPASSAYEG